MQYNARDPVAPDEADVAFADLKRFKHVVLAVSGGPDSMALLVLAAEWRLRQREAAPSISVATIDHRLRQESAAEADAVGREAQRLELSHAILPWTDDKPAAGIADAARQARYRMLDAHARALATDNVAVVTAHHLDDQAETFVMRLARGAGVTGLAGMRGERALFDGSPVRLLRPLLSFPKSRLIATLDVRGIAFADDPTNRDVRYERARLRTVLPELADVGISPAALATSARRLGEAEDALHYAEERFVATLGLSFGNEVFATFDRSAFRAGPSLLRQRLLARLIARYGGASGRPELSEIENLVDRLHAEDATTATLGGTVVSSGSRFVRVWREAGRLIQPDIVLAPGESLEWDRRFIVSRARDSRGPVEVKPLGRENYSRIAEHLSPERRPPARAAHALPSFWIEDNLIAVPSLAPFANSPARPPLEERGCELKALAHSGAY